MPYAKFDTGILRGQLAEIPIKDRPTAIALYQGLVLVSAELLLDGEISGAVLAAVAAEIGVHQPAKRASVAHRIAGQMCSVGALERRANGGYRIVKWHEHHSSRSEVAEARIAAAERKRRSRAQQTLPGVTEKSRSDTGVPSRGDIDRDSRAHVRTRAATASDVEPSVLPSVAQDAGRTDGHQLDDPEPWIDPDPEPVPSPNGSAVELLERLTKEAAQ